MKHVLETGKWKHNRTGEDALSMFHASMTFDLSDGTIPLLTTKKVHIKSIIHEMLWFLAGDTNVNTLKANNVRIWNEWANEKGELGPVYGEMWRAYPSPIEGEPPVDQISRLIDLLINKPNDRRMLVNGWHPALIPIDGVAPKDQADLGRQALPPCHTMWQCYVDESTNTIDMHLYQRSADLFLGVPFNIAQYSILLHVLAHVTGRKPGRFIWTGGDVHIYRNLLDQCNMQVERSPYPSPQLKINTECKDILQLKYEDFEVVNYQSHPTLTGKVAV